MNHLAILETNSEKINSEVELLLEERANKLKQLEAFANSAEGQHEILSYFFQANEISFRMASFLDVEKAIKAMDSGFWAKVMERVQVLDFMSAKERNDWGYKIRELDVPEFTKEVVIPTVENLLLSRRDFLARKVDGIFNALSGTHATNNPGAFSTRMIFNLIGGYGTVSHDKCEFINDLRSVIFQLLGRPKKQHSTYWDISVIQSNKEYGEWLSFDGGAFKLKVFKKGTAHLEINESIALQLNQILAYLYPQAIAPYKRSVKKTYKKFELSENMLGEGTLRALTDARVSSTNSISLWDWSDELANVLAWLGGIKNQSTWNFSYDPRKAIAEVVRLGCIPDRSSYQFYPTEEALADMALSQLNLDERYYKILEPSAGTGNLVENVYNRKNVTCVEISKVNAEVLRSKGYNVENMDFMDYSVNNKFDRIIMNPPFDKGQAKAHLEKAIDHLTEDGVLVAILPASMKKYQNDKVKEVLSSDIISGAFKESGTEVSVVILTIRK